jgi:23S rRNA (uracil1939-C5)-methyltransferase
LIFFVISVADILLDFDIESITPAGDGVALRDGVRIIVPFTIPGERVRARITEPRGKQTSGTLVEIIRASPHRVAAPCPHFGACGGCTWQHIAYPEQLRLKGALVSGLVSAAVRQRLPTVRPAIASTPVDEPWGYRHKVHFVFGNARTGLVMGHYARGTRRVVPVRECAVHDPRGNAVAFRLRDEAARAGVTAANPDLSRGTLRHLAVRIGRATGEMMVTLVVTRDEDKRLRAATRRAVEAGLGVTGRGRNATATNQGRLGDPPSGRIALHLNLHARPDPFIFGPRTRRIIGRDRMREEVAGTSFLVSPTAFFQTNVHAAEVLVRLVLEEVPDDARVLDLYAGAGLFALPLARRGQPVLAVEENRQAVDDGLASLRLNRIPRDRCRFIAKRVEAALRGVRPTDAEALILDPPREGCDRMVLDEIFGRLEPRLAIYVSCNPEALARDLAIIETRGYRIESLQPVDMFPHTAHVETVVVLRR